MAVTPYNIQILVPGVQKAKHGVAAAVLPLLLLAPGSGGAMTSRNANQLNRWVHNPIINIEHSIGQKIDVRSPADQVSAIRTTYGLNMSELASLLGVTRPTVYAWLNGQEPKPDSLVHIRRLVNAIHEINELKVPRIDKLIRRPVFEGRSLLDKIKTNDDIFEALATLRTVAQKEATSRLKQKGSGRSRRSIDEAGADLSTPVYDRS